MRQIGHFCGNGLVADVWRSLKSVFGGPLYSVVFPPYSFFSLYTRSLNSKSVFGGRSCIIFFLVGGVDVCSERLAVAQGVFGTCI